MSLSKHRLSYLPQIATAIVAITLSVGLTLAALHTFPDRLLPAYSTMARDMAVGRSRAIIDRVSTNLSNPRNFVTTAVNRVSASVVRIDTEKTVKTNLPTPFFDDPFFRQFFGDDSLPNLPREFRQYGEGSGFISDP
jgi:S1-C subfamily serine protease